MDVARRHGGRGSRSSSGKSWQLVKASALAHTHTHTHTHAIGEVWLRFAAKCAMIECADVGPELGPLQVGVGTPGGPQCMRHAVQTGLDNHPRDITVPVSYTHLTLPTICSV